MDSIISTFHIDWRNIAFAAFNFAVVYLVLYLFALKPLNKLMAERTQKISKGLEDAKSNAKILEETSKMREEILTSARVEGQRAFEKGKKEGEAKNKEMLENAKKEVAAIIESGKKTFEVEKTKMVNEAKREIAVLAVAATEKILKEKGEIKNI